MLAYQCIQLRCKCGWMMHDSNDGTVTCNNPDCEYNAKIFLQPSPVLVELTEK